jgi:peroxiredoxin
MHARIPKTFLILMSFSLFVILTQIGCKKTIPTGPDTSVTITISGKITQNGQALVNVTVYLSSGSSRKTVTDAGGQYTFSDLPDRDYIVTPSKKGIEFIPSNYELNSSDSQADFTAKNAVYGAAVDSIMRDFKVVNQKGEKVSLYDYFGRVILVNFSADWCGPCRHEASLLEGLYNDFRNKGFFINTLLIDGDPSAWAEQYGLTFTVGDETGRQLWKIYGRGAVPLNIVLDRNCTIRLMEEGFNEANIRNKIERYL